MEYTDYVVNHINNQQVPANLSYIKMSCLKQIRRQYEENPNREDKDYLIRTFMVLKDIDNEQLHQDLLKVGVEFEVNECSSCAKNPKPIIKKGLR